ncbi:MAG: hypothetical protein AAF411_16655 [Myxococcota bacterium]
MNRGYSIADIARKRHGGERRGNRWQHPWTPSEEQRLLDMLESGEELADVAARLGRTPGSLRERLKKIGGGKRLVEKKPNPRRVYYNLRFTPEERDRLHEAAKVAGKPLAELIRDAVFREADELLGD